MKRAGLILLPLICLVLTDASAQALKLVHHFKTGKKYTFELTKTEVSGDSISDQVTAKTNFYLNIGKEDTEGIHGTWTFGPTTITGLDAATTEAVKELLNINKDFKMELILDEEGSIVGIENYDECVEHIKGMIRMIGDMEPGLGEDERTEVENLMATTYADADIMLASYFPEITMYFNCYGGEWSNGTFWMMEGMEFAPELGIEMPCQAEVQVNKIPGGKTELIINELVNQEVYQNALSDFSEELKAAPLPWATELADMQGMEINQIQTHVLDSNTNMVESLTMEKTIWTDDQMITTKEVLKLIK